MNGITDALPTDQDLVAFVRREAVILDEHRHDDWLDLFAPTGRYWMPCLPGQTDPALVGSLMYEDMFMLRVRVERLKNNRTFSQKPLSRSHHLLQMPEVRARSDEEGRYTVWTPFNYCEYRQDEQNFYAGWMTHLLAVLDGELKITLKRVDLLNADAPHRSIQLFM